MKAYSLNMGLNYVNPDHYDGWEGELFACENDARDMSQLATNQGFQSTILLREEVTRQNVISYLTKASKELESGDILMVSYSGHGGWIKDLNGDEDDFMDETWCLFDAQIVDDELYQLWSRFIAGVRILIVSDSCHSGGVVKYVNGPNLRLERFSNLESSEKRVRAAPLKAIKKTYKKNREFYDSLPARKSPTPSINASVKLLSGCQDWELSYDGDQNGEFTGALLSVWDEGNFEGSYQEFRDEIAYEVVMPQTPGYKTFGSPDILFDMQKPFSIHY